MQNIIGTRFVLHIFLVVMTNVLGVMLGAV